MISARNTWSLYKINHTSGKVMWTLGGKNNTFHLGPDTNFSWQHDAQLHRGNVLTLFDDHCCDITGADTYLPATGPSRGLALKLNHGGRLPEPGTNWNV